MRRIQLIIMGLLMILMVSACGASAEAPAAGIEETEKEEQTEDQKEAIVDQTASDKKEDYEETLPVNEIKTLNIYYSNEMADGLEKTQIETDTLSPELLLSNLSNYNIVSRDTKVLSSEVVEERGEKMLLLDMSREFEQYVSSMGTSGEYVIVAAVTNTFLDAYEAQRLRLTVEGDYMETGHAIYDWDLEKYQLTSYTVDTKTYEKKNIRLEYPQLINLKVSYMEDEWNEVLEAYARQDIEYLDDRSEYVLTYETATATEDLLSIVYRVGAYEFGSAHPYTKLLTFNIDLTTGKEWRLKDFTDTQKIVDALESGAFEMHNAAIDKKAFQEYLAANIDMLTKEYFDSFDLDSTNIGAYIPGYSYRLEDDIVLCMEVPHALGDYVEVLIQR